MKILFFGTPDFAVASLHAILHSSHQVLGVVTAPGKPSGRGLQLRQSAVYDFALANALPIYQPEKLKNESFLETIKALEADIFVVVAFRMLPELVWHMPPLGTINVHASLLPDYRGAAPINHAIIQGESKTGVTTFQLKHEIDTGNIWLQESIDILPEDNAGTMYEKLKVAGAALLVKTLDAIASGSLAPRPQASQISAKHAPKLHKDMMRIDWHQKANDIVNLIRGLAPYPGAFCIWQEKSVKIFAAEADLSPHVEQPGHVDTDGKTYLRFAAVDGWVRVKNLQPEGKKAMPIEDFLRGYRPDKK